MVCVDPVDKALLRRRFILFSRKVLSKKKNIPVILEFEVEGERLLLGAVYKDGEGGTVFIERAGEKVPLCGVLEDSDEYKLNIQAFYPLSPVLGELEKNTEIFSKIARS